MYLAIEMETPFNSACHKSKALPLFIFTGDVLWRGGCICFMQKLKDQSMQH